MKPLLLALFFSSQLYAACSDSLMIDYTSMLPPVYNQGGNPWCFAYAARTVLETYRFRKTGEHQTLSMLDLLHKVESPLKNKEQVLLNKIRAGGSPNDVYDAAISSEGIAYESDLPQDIVAFNEKRALLNRLADYYDKKKNGIECTSCLLISASEVGLSSSALDRLANSSKDVDEFLSASIVSKRGELETLFLSSSKLPLASIPKFQLSVFQTDNKERYLDEMVKAVVHDGPTSISLCATNLGEALEEKTISKDCGHHAVVVSGVRGNHGKCEYLIRNSWGASWPFKSRDKRNNPGGGQQWISEDVMKAALQNYEGRHSLASVHDLPKESSYTAKVTMDGTDVIFSKTSQSNADGPFEQYSSTGELIGKGEYKKGSVYNGYQVINGIIFRYKNGVYDAKDVDRQLAKKRKKR